MPYRNAFVTGATGLLGGYIVETLISRGTPVRAIVRNGSDTRLLEKLDVSLTRGDLADEEFTHHAITDADVVYHCAGRTTNWGPWEDFQQGNVEATQNVANACQHHGVARLVHVSSIAVYGHPPLTSGLIDENASLGQNLWSHDHYNNSKIAAENAVSQLGDRATVVRPTWFYGPRDRVFIPRVVSTLRKKAAWILGKRDQKLNGLYVTDVADACVEAAMRDEAAGKAYNLCNHDGISQQELFDILCEAFDCPRVRRRIPLGVARAYAHFVETTARLKRQASPPPISRHSLSVLSRPLIFSNQQAQRDLDWQPKVNHREGLARTIKWIRRGSPPDETSTATPMLTETDGTF
ncbi:MAG: NAD-dependent epimerase/dehydratase family protein, partial [Rhodopirellula sp. JB053]